MTKIIYALIDPRTKEVRYVGRTKNFEQRLRAHNNRATAHKTFKYQWVQELRTLGLKPEYEILDVVAASDAKFWEEFYTDLFRSWGFDLLNNRHYKFGNQTSFQPGENIKPVVAVSKDGLTTREFPSAVAARNELGEIGISNSLGRRKKSAGGFVWFYKGQYDAMSKEEIDSVLKWANTSDLKANSGSFKKGQISHRKINVPDEVTKQVIADYAIDKSNKSQLARKYNIPVSIINRVLNTRL